MQDNTRFIALAKAHGIFLAPESLRIDDIGLDFRVVHGIDQTGVDWILRLPRRDDVLPRAENERRFLKFLASKLPVKVPSWHVCTAELIAYPRIAGTPVVIVDAPGQFHWHLDPENFPPIFLDSLAATLIALHKMDLAAAKDAGFSVPSAQETRQAIAKKVEDGGKNVAIPEIWYRRWQEWLADDSYWPNYVGFVHGDMHAAHILVNEAGSVAGILDWTEAEIGDPATDFAMLHMNFGDKVLQELLQRYRIVFEGWPKIHEHTLQLSSIFPLVVAKFGAIAGDQSYIDQARTMLAKSPSD